MGGINKAKSMAGKWKQKHQMKFIGSKIGTEARQKGNRKEGMQDEQERHSFASRLLGFCGQVEKKKKKKRRERRTRERNRVRRTEGCSFFCDII